MKRPFPLIALLLATATGGPLTAQVPGGMQMGERKLVAQFDKDGDGRLNSGERKAAREFMAANPGPGRAGRGGPMPGGRGGRGMAPATPGITIAPADVKAATTPFYDLGTMRTLFFTFENADWEEELAAFNNTDVEVPATLVVDGKTYRDVGIHFRGASSFFMVPAASKRSLNVALDFVHENQSVPGGYRTLNLLNSNGDPTMMRSVLYQQIARQYLQAGHANFVRVVINGENWGVYPSVQQFNKEWLRDHFSTTEGVRWTVPGSPGGRGGLEYIGEDIAPYKALYEIKSKDTPKSWTAFIQMTKVLNTTPADKLEAALSPILDIDGALKFLALEVALVNSDGYWVRASDYNIYQDPKGRFHILPHDTNETFHNGGGPGGGRGGPGGGVTLDMFTGIDNPARPLLSKLLAVPVLKARYAGYVKDIAQRWLDWKVLGPMVAKHRAVIEAEVMRDTKKLTTNEQFTTGIDAETASLKAFADQRRAFLIK